MSSHAPARAAELLSQLSHPIRFAIVAELAKRAAEGRRPLILAEIAAAVNVPIRDVGDAVSRLFTVGLVDRVGDAYTATLSTLRHAADELDAENPVVGMLADLPRLRGVFSHGRLVGTPDLSIHGHDIARLLARLIEFDGTVDEAEVNRRLNVVSDDVAQLRRIMVNEGVLVRDPAGTSYRMGPRERWESVAVS